MKRILITNLGIALFTLLMFSCGWKPEVTAVPMTAPWSAMNLPVKENTVVWKSEPNEFRAVHKDDKKTVTKITPTLSKHRVGSWENLTSRATATMSR